MKTNKVINITIIIIILIVIINNNIIINFIYFY